MSHSQTAELSKLQVVCSLFNQLIGDDLYYARQIKESIEAAPPSEVDEAKTFLEKAQALAREMNAGSQHTGLAIVDLKGGPFSLLTFRAKLLFAVKSTCRFDKATIILSGLRDTICPKGRHWSPKKAKEYEDALTFARKFCQQRSRPASQIKLILF